MPFGLFNAPATFMRTMDKVFRPYNGKFVINYFDDILFFSRNLEEHVRHLKLVYYALRSNKLFVNLEKSEFCRDMLVFLGNVILAEGVRMDPKKIRAIFEWLTPQSIIYVRIFHGFMNLYKIFIKNFSGVSAPLTKSTKGKSFSWTKAVERSFEHLKRKVTKASILSLPKF